MDLEKAEGTPIGVNCRLCERENCSQRAEPPITRTLILDENTRRVSSFRSRMRGNCERCLDFFLVGLDPAKPTQEHSPHLNERKAGAQSDADNFTAFARPIMMAVLLLAV